MTLVLFGGASAFCCAGFLVLALCRAASRGERIAGEAWARREREIEMETDYYEEHG